MHRKDLSQYLLYIEPPLNEKLADPIEDEWVKLVEAALKTAKKGASHYLDLNCMGNFDPKSNYRGIHITECEQMSEPFDYLLSNGLITNSLAAYYLKWYRNSIFEEDWIKLKALKKKEKFKPIWESTKLLAGLKERFDWAFKNDDNDMYNGLSAVLSPESTKQYPGGTELKGKVTNKIFQSPDFSCKVAMSDQSGAMIYICSDGKIVVLSK